MNAQQKKILGFLAKALGIYLGWYFLFEFWILPKTGIHDVFTLWSSILASEILNGTGILPVYWSVNPENGNVIIHHVVNHIRMVNVGHGCNALSLMVLFSGFILVFPGNTKWKFPYILAGTAVIFILNTLRIVALTWTWYFHNAWTDLNHKYLFTAWMYVVIFGLWLIWIKLSEKKMPAQQPPVE